MSLLAGIDFSGSVSAGNSIWICTAEIRGKGLLVTDLQPARDLPGSSPLREEALASLVDFLLTRGELLVGMDFPFTLPEALTGCKGWQKFVLDFSESFSTPDQFRDCCLHMAGGREWKRPVEIESQVPFSAYNLRLYRQTFHGIRDVLAPLLYSDAVYVPGLMPRCKRRITALEACPACWLKKRDMYFPYKGKSMDARSNREQILDEIESVYRVVFCNENLREAVLANAAGDALDAVLSVLCVRAVMDRLQEAAILQGEGLIAC